MLYVCSWCNHLNEADVESVEVVKCKHCDKWMYSPGESSPKLPACHKCGEKMHGAICAKCLPKF